MAAVDAELDLAAWVEGYSNGADLLAHDPELASYYLGRVVDTSGEIVIDDKKK